MSQQRTFRGVIPPILTCLKEDETVDVVSQRRLVGYLIEGGVHGIFALGSMGEGVNLTPRERERCVEAILAEAKGKVPVLAACSDTSTRRAIENARALQAMGVDALVCTVPYYNSPDRDGILRHYRALASAIDLPLLLYNLPGIVKISLEREVVLELAKEPGIVGIKDSGGNLSDILRLIASLPKGREFPVLQGWDLLVAPSMLLGGAGAVTGLTNLAPNLFCRLYDAAVARDWELAAKLQQQVATDVFDFYTFGSGIAGVKAALSFLGICGPKVSSPLRPASDEDKAKARAKLVSIGMLSK